MTVKDDGHKRIVIEDVQFSFFAIICDINTGISNGMGSLPQEFFSCSLNGVQVGQIQLEPDSLLAGLVFEVFDSRLRFLSTAGGNVYFGIASQENLSRTCQLDGIRCKRRAMHTLVSSFPSPVSNDQNQPPTFI